MLITFFAYKIRVASNIRSYFYFTKKRFAFVFNLYVHLCIINLKT